MIWQFIVHKPDHDLPSNLILLAFTKECGSFMDT